MEKESVWLLTINELTKELKEKGFKITQTNNKNISIQRNKLLIAYGMKDEIINQRVNFIIKYWILDTSLIYIPLDLIKIISKYSKNYLKLNTFNPKWINDKLIEINSENTQITALTNNGSYATFVCNETPITEGSFGVHIIKQNQVMYVGFMSDIRKVESEFKLYPGYSFGTTVFWNTFGDIRHCEDRRKLTQSHWNHPFERMIN